MTRSEFDEWLVYHIGAFGPSLKKHVSQEGEDTLQHWFRAVKNLTLAEAKASTDIMHDDEDSRPRGWSLHPARVKRLALNVSTAQTRGYSTTQKFVDGELVYDCWKCQDTGRLTVYHSQSHQLMRQEGKYFDNTTAVACKCHHGDEWCDPARYVQPIRRLNNQDVLWTDGEAGLRAKYAMETEGEF